MSDDDKPTPLDLAPLGVVRLRLREDSETMAKQRLEAVRALHAEWSEALAASPEPNVVAKMIMLALARALR